MSLNKTHIGKKQIIFRMGIIYLIITGFALYLIFKLVVVMFVKSDIWQERINQIAVDLREAKPERGSIYDASGKLLASSVNYYDIFMDTNAGGLTDKIFLKNVDSLAICLSDFFEDKSKGSYKKKLINGRRHKVRYLKIAEKLTYDEFVKVKNFPLFRLSANKGGFISKRITKRKRPFGELMRRTIGFLGEDKQTGIIQGKAGIEFSYNRELGGRAGKYYMQKIGGGNWRKVKGGEVVQTEDGLDVKTTIDIDIQDYVDDILREQLINLEADYGSVVVMEVKTGYIKAIVNLKRYGDNTFSEIFNYAIGENLAPGSTFKLPVLMAALEDGYVTLNDVIDTGNGHIMYHGVAVDDAGFESYGKIPVWQVFAKSSNVGMLKIIDQNYVKKRRINRFLEQLDAMGITNISGVDIFGEHQPKIKSPGSKTWAPSSPGMIAHGYEVKISPLQILTFYNAVANNGIRVKPRIVKSLEKDGITVKEFEPEISNSLICSKSTLKKAQKILRDVVEYGTARGINNDKYKISGKTGTTEYYDIQLRKHIEQYRGSFVGYFPSDNPKYSVIVEINKPKHDYYGAQAAAPVFKKIADNIFSRDREINPPEEKVVPDSLKIPQSKIAYADDLNFVLNAMNYKAGNNNNLWISAFPKNKKLSFETKMISDERVPDVKKMGAKDAVFILENCGLKVSARGRGEVVYQSLKPGTEINKGMKINLVLN
ncbi:MAG: transpeptidase family protein [Bacteroidales bacterium]|nr:transpeptidase family protein [Bacteroidales bacterium]